VDHLLRANAPISDAGWELLDTEARGRLTTVLAARRLVDFSGPHGWQHSATNLGRTSALAAAPSKQVSGLQRRVLPLVEARAEFEVSRAELRDGDRGADDVDLTQLDKAAHQLAVTENVAVFDGWKGAFVGISEASPHEQLPLGDAADAYPARVAEAVDALRGAGVDGPYAMALGREHYRNALGGAERGGYPLIEHLQQILGGAIVWAPGLDAAIVLSKRGGDFVFECGQDVSIGYQSHDEETVRLYLEESFSFHVATPEAAVVLRP
jgi:uncharacterized linocin/CFP29 family protein